MKAILLDICFQKSMRMHTFAIPSMGQYKRLYSNHMHGPACILFAVPACIFVENALLVQLFVEENISQYFLFVSLDQLRKFIDSENFQIYSKHTENYGIARQQFINYCGCKPALTASIKYR